jgi:hypothetical protein
MRSSAAASVSFQFPVHEKTDVALAMRTERLISRMFSQIAINRIGKSDTSDRAAG